MTFTTQSPAPDITKVVAKDGSGDYTTIQAAFDAVPDYYTGKYTIYVKPGIYKEKVVLAKNKVNVILGNFRSKK
ncbi:pectinesterase family protein, partial [Thermophagus xiamenensis]